MKKADFVLCADLHIMEKKPVCRTDEDFHDKQFEKLRFIDSLAKKHECGVLCSGDFFDFWKHSPELISRTMDCLSARWWSIYGDHDLQNHSFDMKHKSALTTLVKAGKVRILEGGHGTDKSNSKLKNARPSKRIEYVTKAGIKERNILAWHVLTWKKELPFPDCETSNAKKLLKKYPQFDLIVTGDNHLPFVEKHKGRLLVNTGSMMRIRADQKDYKPAVWLYYAKTNTVEKVYLPIEEGVISREHIETKKKREDRIDSYVSSMSTNYKTEMSFESNLETHYAKNRTKKKVKQLITEAMHDEKKD